MKKEWAPQIWKLCHWSSWSYQNYSDSYIKVYVAIILLGHFNENPSNIQQIGTKLEQFQLDSLFTDLTNSALEDQTLALDWRI